MVAFDADYALRDIFYPQVGLENHTAGSVCRTGFFLDGRFAWEIGDVEPLPLPIPLRGLQRLFEWKGPEHEA